MNSLGEIVEVGSDVTRVKVGDRVTIEPILAEHNLIGDYNLDPNLNFVGLAADGGFAKYCVLDGDLVHVIPDSLSYEQAALTEPAVVAVCSSSICIESWEIQLLSLAWVQLVFDR